MEKYIHFFIFIISILCLILSYVFFLYKVIMLLYKSSRTILKKFKAGFNKRENIQGFVTGVTLVILGIVLSLYPFYQLIDRFNRNYYVRIFPPVLARLTAEALSIIFHQMIIFGLLLINIFALNFIIENRQKEINDLRASNHSSEENTD